MATEIDAKASAMSAVLEEKLDILVGRMVLDIRRGVASPSISDPSDTPVSLSEAIDSSGEVMAEAFDSIAAIMQSVAGDPKEGTSTQSDEWLSEKMEAAKKRAKLIKEGSFQGYPEGEKDLPGELASLVANMNDKVEEIRKEFVTEGHLLRLRDRQRGK